MSLKQKVMSGLIWTAGGKFLAQFISWGITIIVIRLLSPEDYGLMALASVFIGFLAMLNELGMGAAIIQRKELDPSTFKSLFGLILLVSTLFFLILALTAPFIAIFYNEPRLVLLVQILALEFLINGFSIMPRSLLLREMKFRSVAIVEFVTAISGSFVTLLLALAGYGVWALVGGVLLMRLVSLVGFNIAHPFLCLPSFNFKGLGSFFAFGGYFSLTKVLWYFYSSFDVFIIGKVLGQDLLGFYSVGFMLASLPMEKFNGIIIRVAFPAFSSIQSDQDIYIRHFLKGIRILSFITFPVLWGISSISPEIITVFLGDKWQQAALPMQIIAIIVPLRMINSVLSTAVFSKGRLDICFYMVGVPFVLMPIGFYIGTAWGLLGVSLAWVILFPVALCLQISLALSVLSISFYTVLRSIWLSFGAGIVMYGSVYFIKSVKVFYLPPIPGMVTLIISGALSYLLMTVLINRDGLQEFVSLLKK